MVRESFVFYRSFHEATKDLEGEDYASAIKNIVSYAMDGTEPADMTPIAKAIFMMAKPQIDANNKRYINGCKGGEFGHLGGARVGNQNARKRPQNNPKTTPNDNENENDNDIYMPKRSKSKSKIHNFRERNDDFDEIAQALISNGVT